jgi:3-oxoacyl-(acyl-carrier-protein) synthase
VIYTSGSTGRPKGVEISHEALSNLLLSAQKTLKCNETDKFLAITTVSFDIAALELFLPLLCGAVIVIAQRQDTKDASALHSLIRQNAVTMMQATPTTWQMLLEYGFQKNSGHSLSKILCGGEALPPKLADALLRVGDGRCTVWNMYGPTEATVWASAWVVESDKPVVIGRPLSNYKLYVLDHDLTPTPLGAIGELYIGGSSLARCYRNNADLTSLRFIKNPFHDGLMYRTGDLARFLAPGELAVVGRADSQVKVRGYRIELGDIESAIVACDEISEAVVVYRDQRLVAYYTAEHVAGDVTGRLPTLGDKLRAWLVKRLPPYMTPDFFVALKEFPKTLNNKIDRKALPAPLTSAVPAKSAVAESITEMEVHILDIWSRVLGLDRNLINRDSNFFQIGGNSVLAVRVQSALEQLLGRPVKAAKLFEHFTMKTLAAHLVSSDSLANMDSSIEEPQRKWQQQRITNTIQQDDIAIVSMACRLPGAATTPAKYWELLVNGVDAITEVPKDAEALYSAAPKTPGKSCCRRGGFVDSVDSFDASFFSLSPREARDLEPAQNLMLETCWEGLENAGYTTDKLHGSETGVYIGISNIAAHSGSSYDAQDLGGYAGTGSASSTISGRISYILGLEGPTLTVDTACSSSLVATHLACSALKQGECDMAVVGGVTLLLSPGIHIEFSQLGGMSPDGRCRAFSEDSEGTGWAEGATVVVLKRLSDARRDCDTIHGVLRGSAVNHGGRSASLTTPSGPAQQRLIRSALSASGLTPGEIDYIEAHGTGTKLGDPIEGEALAAVFRDSRENIEQQPPLGIGSAKSNIGHTQAAAGLAGLIKVVLALRNETLPPTLHVTQPTPGVDWQGAHMAPVQEKRAWPLLTGEKSRLRRAGVSAFGIGGTNAHVIVEEPPRQLTAATTSQSQTNCMYLKPFLLSGHTDASLYEQAKKLHLHLSKRSVKLSDDDAQGAQNPDNSQGYAADVAYSLATTRNHFQKRLVLIAQDEADLVQKLAAVPTRGIYTPKDHDQGQGSRIAMLFTGQGSQLPGMGRDLANQYPVFQETVVQIASHFDSELDHALLDVMWAEPSGAHSRLLEQTNYAQPALFTLQVGLSRLWESWGVQTDYVLGHCIGEIAAAHIAGVMSLSDACRLVASRGRLMHQLPCRGGSMVSLEASASEVTKAM